MKPNNGTSLKLVAFMLANGISVEDLDIAYYLHRSGYVSHIPIDGCSKFTIRQLLSGAVFFTTKEEEGKETSYLSQLKSTEDGFQITTHDKGVYTTHYFNAKEFLELIKCVI